MLFIIVVIVYLQYLEEKWKEREVLPHTSYASAANASHDNLRIP